MVGINPRGIAVGISLFAVCYLLLTVSEPIVVNITEQAGNLNTFSSMLAVIDLCKLIYQNTLLTSAIIAVIYIFLSGLIHEAVISEF